MNEYHPDWVGAIGAGIGGIFAFLVASAIFQRRSGVAFYLVVGLLVFAFSLGIRVVLRYFGI